MSERKKGNEKSSSGRPHVGVLFECCNIYSRIYINGERTAYVGWCPKCAAKLEIPIDPHGTDDRFFRAR